MQIGGVWDLISNNFFSTCFCSLLYVMYELLQTEMVLWRRAFACCLFTLLLIDLKLVVYHLFTTHHCIYYNVNNITPKQTCCCCCFFNYSSLSAQQNQMMCCVTFVRKNFLISYQIRITMPVQSYFKFILCVCNDERFTVE